MTADDTAAAHRAIEAVWRLESARIIAGLAGLLRDVGLAEELAQDALVAALEQWPADGIPANPGAWLMLTARHRAIDRIRRNERLAGKLNLLGRELETAQHGAPAEFDDVLDEGRIDDDLLRLMFISCHPVLSTEARIALTLRLLGGLTTEEIARAFLAAEPTIAKRIVRAKQTLASRQVPFEVPSPAERPGPAGLRARGALPGVQRGILGDGGGRLDAPGAVHRGAPPRPRAGRADAGRTRGARPGRADGDPGVAAGGPARARTGCRCRCPSRTAAAGTSC